MQALSLAVLYLVSRLADCFRWSRLRRSTHFFTQSTTSILLLLFDPVWVWCFHRPAPRRVGWFSSNSWQWCLVFTCLFDGRAASYSGYDNLDLNHNLSSPHLLKYKRWRCPPSAGKWTTVWWRDSAAPLLRSCFTQQQSKEQAEMLWPSAGLNTNSMLSPDTRKTTSYCPMYWGPRPIEAGVEPRPTALTWLPIRSLPPVMATPSLVGEHC
jgi:hypothetical protein